MYMNLQTKLTINHIKEEILDFQERLKKAQNEILMLNQTKQLQSLLLTSRNQEYSHINYKIENDDIYLNRSNKNSSLEMQCDQKTMLAQCEPKRKTEDIDETDNQQNCIYSQIQSEQSLSQQTQKYISQEIDLTTDKIRKVKIIENMKNKRYTYINQNICLTDVQNSSINPIYQYQDYLNKFNNYQSNDLIQFRQAKVRKLNDPISKSISNQNKNLLNGSSIEDQLFAGQQVKLDFSLLQSMNFQLEKYKIPQSNAIEFMQNYPLNRILQCNQKKAKKIALKQIQQNIFTIANEDNQDQNKQYNLLQQNILNFINLEEIIKNSNPQSGISNLIESQFFYFMIGDYKKMKYLKDNFSSSQQQLNSQNKCSQPQEEDFNQYLVISDSNSSSENSANYQVEVQQDCAYSIDEFIDFKSQATTTSKITKMQKNQLDNTFEDFSLNQKDKKQSNKNQFYNLPKYTMVFILELLSSKNLKRLGVCQEYKFLIERVVKNIKKSAKSKEQNRKIMYNHNHYNCLFLKLNQYNISEIMNQQDLKNLHMKVFGVQNLLSQFDNLYINIIKKVIERIILIQLFLIQDFPLAKYIINNKELYLFEKSKINYIERVISGISKLRDGEIIKRF